MGKEKFGNVNEAIRFLQRMRVDVDAGEKRVVTKPIYGLRVWGAIDYLVNYHGYQQVNTGA